MPKNVYERFAERIAADARYPARANVSSPPAEMAEFAWLAGAWTWEMQIHATPTTPARVVRGDYRFAPKGFSIWMSSGSEDPIPYLTWDAFQRLWVLSLVTKTAQGILKSSGWRNGGAVFEGNMTFMGCGMHLRQTWRRNGESELHFFNEELLKGSWYPVDEIINRRV